MNAIGTATQGMISTSQRFDASAVCSVQSRVASIAPNRRPHRARAAASVTR